MFRNLRLSWHLLVGWITLVSVIGAGSRVDAADSVVLKYLFLRETVSVPELVTFAETGELSTSLETYLKLAKREPAELRGALTQEVNVNSTFLYRALTNPIGEALLDQVSQVVHTPTNRANREALRSALVSSALSDSQITLIETLENYPTAEVHVEGDRLVEIAQTLSRVLGSVPNINL